MKEATLPALMPFAADPRAGRATGAGADRGAGRGADRHAGAGADRHVGAGAGADRHAGAGAGADRHAGAGAGVGAGAIAEEAGGRPVLEFGAVFREHGAFVLRTVRRMGVPASEVEDVAQNVFLVVHRHLRSYEGRGSVKAWVFGIVRRAVADHRRQRRRRPEVPVLEPPVGAVEPETEASLDRARERALLDRALDSLDEAKREVFVLFELEQMAMVDVAAAVGCPVQTAYSRLYAARERVKELVLAASRGGERGRAA